MTENERNRRWLIVNRVFDRTPESARLPEDLDALTYYKEQLETELEGVRQMLTRMTLTRAAD